VWECPLCRRQTVVLEGECHPVKPYICDLGHRTVEMEQRMIEAFESNRQTTNWEADGR